MAGFYKYSYEELSVIKARNFLTNRVAFQLTQRHPVTFTSSDSLAQQFIQRPG
jgi:hypothetical protein